MKIDECELRCNTIADNAKSLNEFNEILNLIDGLELKEREKCLVMLLTLNRFLKNYYTLEELTMHEVTWNYVRSYLGHKFKIESYSTLLFDKSKNDILTIPRDVLNKLSQVSDEILDDDSISTYSEEDKIHLVELSRGKLPDGYIIGD